ncbi:hypothetical protein H5P28_09035 [Ruficoccus amylovorans]|uniref:Uncharacterized protein n=1 Tax=Ruficoccus amylovorans TaxID=1804625 RepID=A0A842HDU2_9BACT|nr:hypothetical protein [Ruficoccus amylovorans]MBC2594399.1 hypothetical protein [Ruficoccus amylovorans]
MRKINLIVKRLALTLPVAVDRSKAWDIRESIVACASTLSVVSVCDPELYLKIVGRRISGAKAMEAIIFRKGDDALRSRWPNFDYSFLEDIMLLLPYPDPAIAVNEYRKIVSRINERNFLRTMLDAPISKNYANTLFVGYTDQRTFAFSADILRKSICPAIELAVHHE